MFAEGGYGHPVSITTEHGPYHARQRQLSSNYIHQDTVFTRSSEVHLHDVLCRVLVAGTMPAARRRFLYSTVQVLPEATVHGQHLHRPVGEATETSAQSL